MRAGTGRGSFRPARELTRQFPTFYSNFFYQGAALYHLGKKQEALKPLDVYVQYSKDESNYPIAVIWLNEIKTQKTSSD